MIQDLVLLECVCAHLLCESAAYQIFQLHTLPAGGGSAPQSRVSLQSKYQTDEEDDEEETRMRAETKLITTAFPASARASRPSGCVVTGYP